MDWRAWIAGASVAGCVVTTSHAQPAPTDISAAPKTSPASFPATAPSTGRARVAPGDLVVEGKSASTWQEGSTSVVLMTGPVVIRTDESTLRADNAVIWLDSAPDTFGTQRASIALLGNSRIEADDATQIGDRLFVTTIVQGNLRFEADRRVAEDLSKSDFYDAAQLLRSREQLSAPAVPSTQATTAPTTQPVVGSDVQRRRGNPAAPLADIAAGTTIRIDGSLSGTTVVNNKVAYIFPKISLFYRFPDGAYAEMYADHAVAFTSLDSSKDAGDFAKGQAAIEAVYLEGDVRVIYMPAGGKIDIGETKMTAKSCYFRFSDRTAVLTKAVLHTEDLKTGIPFVLRAKTLKQLAEGEYEARGVQLTTSQFARPSFAIEASRIYVHRPRDGDGGRGAGGDGGGDDFGPTRFRSVNTVFKFFGVPLFYLPVASGTATGRGAPIRDAAIERRTDNGLGVKTTWGLFETVGLEPPKDLDASYRLDYFSDRGPAGGLNADYQGGLITETSQQRVAFEGDIDSYFVKDHGTDSLGSGRAGVDYDEVRGIAGIQHQHFFPYGWQLQTQAYYVSDATFLEQWFERSFDEGNPRDTSLYLKHQQGNEAFTLLGNIQPNGVVTTADLQQEQFEVEHVPEIAYHMIGGGLGDFGTLYSDNSLSGLEYKLSDATLQEQGFIPGQSTPGAPSLGLTGTTDDTIYRGDFRQEIQFPFSLGQVRAVPYVIGRYTTYSDSPFGKEQNRFYAGAGARLTTSFWRVDDRAYSDLFDIHRMRHVIEPELNFFAGAQNVDRNDVYIFEEPIDDISDIRAMEIALHQRWQTKRGGPGHWHSVDLFTLNVEGDFFKNRPDTPPIFRNALPIDRPPNDFRGQFFTSSPETSIPRNALNVDGSWRLSDSTVIIGDLQYNLDHAKLATGSIGLNVSREDRLNYYVGLRYIEPFGSYFGTIAMDYQITSKYIISANQSYDFGAGDNVVTAATLTRKFDKFYLQVSYAVDRRNEENTFSVNFVPEGVPISSALVQSWIPQER